MLKAYRNTEVSGFQIRMQDAEVVDQWWAEVAAMAVTSNEALGEAKERLGALTLAVAQFISGSEPLNSLFPGSDAASITKLLLQLADQFGLNSFSLTSPDLSNIGVAVCPTVALINHSCLPNCAVVFPEGPAKKMHVIAFLDIEAGQEVVSLKSLSAFIAHQVPVQILSSYVDLTGPTLRRQEDLISQYKFTCRCAACSPIGIEIDPRRALRCSKHSCKGLLPFPGQGIPRAPG